MAWETVYSFNLTTENGAADNTGNNGYTFVWTIPLAAFSQTGGTKIRLTLQGAAVEGTEMSGLYIGDGGGTDGYDFGEAPVQVTKDASGTITIGAGASLVTDEINFVKDGTNPLIVAAQFQNSSADNVRMASTGSPAGSNCWFKTGAEASTQDKSTYGVLSANAGLVTQIDLYIGAVVSNLWLADAALDNGLAALGDADSLFLCSDAPTSYDDATNTYAMGSGSVSVGVPQAHTGGGRQVVVAEVTGSVSADGTPACWALVNSAASPGELLAYGNLDAGSPGDIATGQSFTLATMTLVQEGVEAA